MDISSIRNIQSDAISQAASQTKLQGDSTFDSIFSTSIVDIVFFGHVGQVFIYNLWFRLIYLFV